MTDVKDLTVPILRSIRDELRLLGGRVDKTNDRLDKTNERLEKTNERIDETNRRLAHSEIRLATQMAQLAGNINDLTQHLKQQHTLRPRVEKCERGIDKIKRRMAG